MTRHLLLFSLLLGLFVSNAMGQVNIYVDANRPSDGNGTSWSNAYKDLNQALKYVNAQSGGKYDIHIAQGTYKPSDVSLRAEPFSSDNQLVTNSRNSPDYSSGLSTGLTFLEYGMTGDPKKLYPNTETNVTNINALGARDWAFSIKRAGVRLFGGYPSGGGTRNIAANPTIIDGDLGTANQFSDNAHHLLIIGAAKDNWIATGDSVVVDGLTFRNANANGTQTVRCNGYGIIQSQGGAIYNIFEAVSGNTEQVAIRNCTFTSNFAYFGAAIFNQNSNATIFNCTFTSNSCSAGGAAIYNSAGAPKIRNCTFNSNTSAFIGAAIYNASSNCIITNSSFNSNTAEKTASCIYTHSGSPSISNCTFSNNSSSADAGVIRSDRATMVIADSRFSQNTAATHGGAILNVHSVLTVRNTTFANNTATLRAGAVWIRGNASTRFTDCVFDGNTVTNTSDNNHGLAGAVLADSSAATVFTNTTFKNNSAKRSGAFMGIVNTNLSFENCLFEKNTASYVSAISSIESGNTVTVNNSKFLSNACTSNGKPITSLGTPGGLFVVSGTINVNNSLFHANESLNTPGGCIRVHGTGTIKSSVFIKNKSDEYGAAIYAAANTTNIINSTFYDNQTLGYSGYMGVYCDQGAFMNIRNSILFDGSVGFYNYGTTHISNSFVRGGAESATSRTNVNTTNFPVFVSASNLIGNDRVWGTLDDGLRLYWDANTPNSSFINNGNNSFVTTDMQKDVTGNIRNVGGTVDVGAYEYTSITLTPANVLTFDGVDDHISLPYRTIPNALTFETRIKTNSTQTQGLFALGSSTNTIIVQLKSGRVSYIERRNGTDFEVITTNSIADGNWHHIAVSRDISSGSNKVNIYIDGTLTNSGSSNAISTITCDRSYLGALNSGLSTFNGQMDETRIWNRALCGGEISTYRSCELGTTKPSGLLGYYNFNQGYSGMANTGVTTLNDVSGNTNNGTLNNFNLAGTNNWMQTNLAVSGTCGAFTAPTITASNSGPHATGAELILTASDGFDSYAWTGPNGFTSAVKIPVLTNVQTSAAGTYNLSATQNGCVATASTNVVVNSNPASALAFDSHNDHITVPHYQLGNEFTIEINFKTASLKGSDLISWLGTGASTILHVTEKGEILLVKSIGQSFEYYTGTQNKTFNDNQWHHLAVTQNASKLIKVFVDGIELYSYYGTFSSMPVTSSLRINGLPGGHGYMAGELDELRVWNRTLCGDEINNSKSCEISPTSNGLIIYYQFNQGNHNANNSGVTTITDLAGGDHNGTLQNFALSGTSSNWVLASGTGSVISGTNCGSFTVNNSKLSAITGKGVTILNGDTSPSATDDTDFGVVNNAITTSKIFTISNTGSEALSISGITVSGTDASFFTISGAPTSVAANSTATFTVNFAPASTVATKRATVTVSSGDCKNPEFTFSVSGTGFSQSPGAALHFDGHNDYIQVPSITLGDNFTIELRVKTSRGDQGIFSLQEAGNVSRGLYSSYGNLNYYETDGTGNSYSSASQINNNQWHHIAIVRTSANSDNVTYYMDGAYVGKSTINKSVTPATLFIGSLNNGSSPFFGDIDEFRVWNRALCSAEIANNYNCEVSPSANGLYAYYQFNQGYSATNNTTLASLTDATSNAKHGTFKNFALNGTTSNFVANGGVATGTSCGTLQLADITVKNASNVNIANNSTTTSLTDNTDFGNVDINANPLVTTFTIQNAGTSTLNLRSTNKIVVSGTGFSLAQDASAVIAAGESTTFKVAFDPNVTNVHNGIVTIYSDDCNKPVYTFAIKGTGIAAPTGAALNFASSSLNRVSVNTSSAAEIRDNFTVEMWVKPASLQNSTLFTTREQGDYSFDIQLTSSGGLHGDIGTGSNWLTTAADASVGYTAGRWFHVAYVVTPSKYEIYYNGTLTASGTYSSSSPLLFNPINKQLTMGINFAGEIDEVRVWNKALCSGEIFNSINAEISGTPTGLKAYYKFNQGQKSGSNANELSLTDDSGNGLNGTLNYFTLSGTTSNWIAPGGVTTGNSASTFVAPQISVSGNSTQIANNDNTPAAGDHTDFGDVDISATPLTYTYTINNTGSGSLHLTKSTKVSVTGTGFSLVQDAAASVASGGNTTFSIAFDPNTTGAHTGTVTIYSNDCNNSFYSFAISGNGTALPDATALHFDGYDDHINVPSVTVGDNFTIEAYVKTSGGGNIISLQQSGSIARALYLSYGHVNYSEYDGTSVAYSSGGPKVDDNQWHHVAIVRTSEAEHNVSFYVDGVFQNKSTISRTVSPTSLQIGSYNGGYFLGNIDEVRVWNRALCKGEILNNWKGELNTGQTDLIAYFKFNQGAGGGTNTTETTLLNAVAGGSNGTLANFALTGATSNWSTPGGGIITGNFVTTSGPTEMAISGKGTIISNGDTSPSYADDTDFADVNIDAGALTKTFTIQNQGTHPLILSGTKKVTVSGTGFSLVQDASSPVVAGGSTTFQIAFDPGVTGTHTGTVTVYSNDCDETTHSFTIQGFGTGEPTAAALNFATAEGCKVTIDNTANLTVSHNYTVEMWVKPNSLQNAGIFSTREPIDGTFDIQLTSTGGLHGDIGDGYSWYTTAADANVGYKAGEWFHVTYVVSPQKYEIYYNGRLASSAAFDYFYDQALLFDGSHNKIILGNGFDGSMDEVRVWNRSLCAGEIINNMNAELNGSQSGLVAYYKFNQGQNGDVNINQKTLTDASGNGLNGTLNNFTLLNTTSNWVAPGGVTTANYAAAFVQAEITVSGNATEIVNGDNSPVVTDNTDWGIVNVNGSKTHTFTISNPGLGNLQLLGSPKVVVSGTGFALASDVSDATILPNGTAEFTITFSPVDQTVYNGTVTIYSGDCDEHIYTFSLKGEGYQPVPSAALTFDGNDDFIALPNTVSSDFTIEYWMKTTMTGQVLCDNWYCGNGIVDAEVGGVTNDFGTALVGTKLAFGIGNPDLTIKSVSDVNTGEWVHVTATWKQTTGEMKLYINGVLEASGTSGTALRSAPPRILIGALQTNLRYFNGSIDEVRIWNTALCETEINHNKNCEVAGTPANLRSYYRFNEYFGDWTNTGNVSLTDHSGNNNTGSLNNFALTGTSSNWTSSSVITSGTNCVAYDAAEAVVSGNGVIIANNDNNPIIADGRDFGFIDSGASRSQTFNISNSSNVNSLEVTNVVVSGSGFSLTSDPTGTLAAGGEATFSIQFAPVTQEIHTGTVTVYTSDCLTPAYAFQIKGSSIPAAALSFDGNNDIINLGTGINAALDSLNEITVEAWVYPLNTVFNGVIVGNYNNPLNELQFLLRRDGSNYTFWVNVGSGYQSVATSSVEVNTWQHVAGVWNGSDLKIYVNGVLMATQTGVTGATFINGVTNYISIGNNGIPEPFAGTIDEVRVWSRALCVSEISHNLNAEVSLPQTGLLAYYQFNQGGAEYNNTNINTLSDASGNHFDGTLNNFALTGSNSNWLETGGVVSKSNSGVYFPAEIDVIGNGVSIANNDHTPSVNDATDFGSGLQGSSSVSKVFTIHNSGNKVLNLTGSPRVSVTGSAFTLVTDAPATIQPGASATFEVRFDPTIVGVSTGTISIANDDCDEGLYSFSIQGTGREADPANALHFDGVDDYVAITNPYYQFEKEITVEWHVNIESAQMGSGIGQGTSNVDDPSTNMWLMHLLPDHSITFGANPNAGGGMAYAPPMSQGWHHITGVATAEYTKIYVDGILVNTTAGYAGASITANSASEIHFGKDVRYSAGRFFGGKMDEVRIWNRVLSKAEITNFASCERNVASDNPKGLVGYYKFNQGLEQSDNSTVTQIVDGSTLSKNGTLNNFALNGSTSNWVYESPVVAENYCTPCTVANTTVSVNECSGSYLSPSGKFTWTSSGTFTDTLMTQFGCDSVITVNLTINNINMDLTMTPSSLVICSAGDSEQFTLNGTEAGVDYSLVNLADNSTVATIAGGGDLVFNTGAVNTSTTFGITASKSGCTKSLTNQLSVTVSSIPSTTFTVSDSTIFANELNASFQWLDCSAAMTPIAGETSGSFTATGTGSYAFEITNSFGCKDTSSCYNFIERTPASALQFDGKGDYVTIPKIVSSDFTIEYWMKTTASGRIGSQWYEGNGIVDAEVGNVVNDFGTSLLGNKLAFGIGNPDKTIISTTDVNTGNWTHVAVSWKQTTGEMKLYINGTLEASGMSGTALRNAPSRITLGSLQTLYSFYEGSLDEVRIWNKVLTPAQIVNNRNCEINGSLPGLMANYHFNQGDAANTNTNVTLLADSSGVGNNGQLYGFDLYGTASNWMSPGAVVNGSACQACEPSSSTQNVTTCGEAYVSPSGRYTWTTTGTYTDTLYNVVGCDSIITVNLKNNQFTASVSIVGEALVASESNATYQWLNCDNGLAAISGETSQSFSPSADGNYAVIVTNKSCVDTTACVMFTLPAQFSQQSCIGSGDYNDRMGPSASGDFDGDGDLDFVVTTEPGEIRLYTNDGSGNFGSYTVVLPPGSYYYRLAAGDLDGDGDLDLVAYNESARVFINNGTGSFTQLATTTLINGTGSIGAVAIGDVNNDGKMDIVTGNRSYSASTDMNEVWLNTGTTGNAAFTYHSGVQNTNGDRNSLALGDIDGDGDLDMITGSSSWTGYAYLNDGAGNYTLHQIFNEYSGGVRLIDWNNDGHLDKVHYDTYNNHGLRYALNDGKGTFPAVSTHVLSRVGANVCIVSDLNGDGYPDVILNEGGANPEVYLNNGCSVNLQSHMTFSTAAGGFEVADFNGDGKKDIFCKTGNATSCLFINNMAPVTAVPLPKVTSVTPASACGTSAQMNLSATADNNGTLRWYNVATGGSVLSTGPNFTTETLTSSAIYYVEAVSPFGCASPRTAVYATLNPSPVVAILTNSKSRVCKGSSITLAGTGANAYTWNKGVIDNTAFTINATETFTVIGTDENGCTGTASITITVDEGESTSIAASICQGESYSFNKQSYTEAGTYVANLTNTFGCDSVVTLELVVLDLPVVSFSFTEDRICTAESSISLTATPAGGTFSGPGVSGETFDPAMIENPGFVTVSYSYNDGNCSVIATDSIYVDVCTGLKKEENLDVRIIPNPASKVVTITTGTLIPHSVVITNLQGIVVYASEIKGEKQVALDRFMPGAYFVRVHDGNKVYNSKLIVL